MTKTVISTSTDEESSIAFIQDSFYVLQNYFREINGNPLMNIDITGALFTLSLSMLNSQCKEAVTNGNVRN